MQPAEQSDPASAPAAPPPHFFAVSVAKLAVMSVATAGVYELYWFYQHWQRVRARTGESLSPALRALFNIVFAFPLFRRIGEDAPEKERSVPALLLATVFVAVGMASLLPLPEPWTFIGLLAIFPLLEVQSQANRANRLRTPSALPNARLTSTNLLGLAACAALWTVGITNLVQTRRDPGSAFNLAEVADDARQGLPRVVSAGVKLIEVNTAPRKLSYSYLVADDAAPRFKEDPYRREAGRTLVQQACAGGASRRMLDADVTLEHTYRSRSNEALMALSITRASCGSAAQPASTQV